VSTETTSGATGEGRRDEGLRDEGLRDEPGRHDEGGVRDDARRHDGGAGGGAGGPDDGPGRYTAQHGDQPGQHDHDAGSDGVTVLDPSASERLRGRWQEVQAAFVDEPRQAVTEADQLVGEVLDEVSRVFRDQRSELEAEWSGNNEPGTEELRQALRRYREFFDRLLSL
jgi:hypothetical protein